MKSVIAHHIDYDSIKHIKSIEDIRGGGQTITYEERIVLHIPRENTKPRVEPPNCIVKPLELDSSGWRTDIAVEVSDTHVHSDDYKFEGSEDTIIFTPYFTSLGDATIPADKLSKLKKHIPDEGREIYFYAEVTIYANSILKGSDESMLQRLK